MNLSREHQMLIAAALTLVGLWGWLAVAEVWERRRQSAGGGKGGGPCP